MKKSVLFVATTVLSVGLAANAATAVKTQSQKLSYAMGYHNAKYLQKNNKEFNLKLYAKGFSDAIYGKKPSLSKTQMDAVVKKYMQQRIQKFKKLYEKQMKSAQDSKAFFEENAKKPGVKTTASGLQYKVIDAGSGEKPDASDQVVVDYTGSYTDGTVFDASAKHGGPATFPVNGVVPGFKEALLMMPKGSTYEVYIPPNLGYGVRGIPGAIKPNAVLVFKIHLRDIKKK